jgi:hypothetical protein
MTAAHLSIPPRALDPEPPSEIDLADDILPVVGVVVQAGPPAYVIAAFGAVITLLACFPLMILVAVLVIGLAVTALLAALAAGLVVVPMQLVRASRDRPVTHGLLRSIASSWPRALGARPARRQRAGRAI